MPLSNIAMKLFGTTVFIVGLQKADNTRACSKYLICGAIVVKGMEVFFQHFTVNCDSGTDEPGIAVHAVFNGLWVCCVGFLSQDIA